MKPGVVILALILSVQNACAGLELRVQYDEGPLRQSTECFVAEPKWCIGSDTPACTCQPIAC